MGKMRPIPINTESDHLLSVTIYIDNKEPTNAALKRGLWKTVGASRSVGQNVTM